MKPKLLTCMLSGLLFAPIPASSMGGWAVVTVQDLPDFVVPGRSFDLVFSVTQHGVKPLDDLLPTVEFVNGDTRRTVPGVATAEKGRYRATVEFPRPGDWAVTINSGFGSSRVTLVPITAVQVAGALPSLPEAERGRRLFVAKGCVPCHTHAEAPAEQSWNVGPELTGRRYPEELLVRRLTDPKSVLADARMPNLHLRPAEIVSLTAFINMERQAAR